MGIALRMLLICLITPLLATVTQSDPPDEADRMRLMARHRALMARLALLRQAQVAEQDEPRRTELYFPTWGEPPSLACLAAKRCDIRCLKSDGCVLFRIPQERGLHDEEPGSPRGGPGPGRDVAIDRDAALPGFGRGSLRFDAVQIVDALSERTTDNPETSAAEVDAVGEATPVPALGPVMLGLSTVVLARRCAPGGRPARSPDRNGAGSSPTGRSSAPLPGRPPGSSWERAAPERGAALY